MSEWISVEDRLPEEQTYVLGYGPEIDYQINLYSYSKAFGWISFEGDDCNGLMTHWMPLPEPPEEA